MNYRNDDIYRHNKAVIRRRRAEVRRQKLILSGVLIAAVLILTFSLGARLTFAKSNNDNSVRRVKYYKAVMIKCGDSMNKIAKDIYTDDFKDVDSFIHEIKVINHLDEDEELIAGNFLTIPYYIDHTAEYN